ncbi:MULTISPECIES: HNH endonuclease [Nocardioides]|uniref:HNH endonuclease n=1 Tax=Nocardioides vastitatis TaxID=2568655 RepID=A0ABW0ZMW2_9ACTN|nr:HNH endonuclease [Nocardioides sp.]
MPCRHCAVSLADEPHLLLEVDHIVPVSKGGLSTPENLQTLCWRCNRRKSNKSPQTATPRLAPKLAPSTATEVAPDVVHTEAPAVVAPQSANVNVEGQLVKLRELYDAGLFTDAEYEARRQSCSTARRTALLTSGPFGALPISRRPARSSPRGPNHTTDSAASLPVCEGRRPLGELLTPRAGCLFVQHRGIAPRLFRLGEGEAETGPEV